MRPTPTETAYPSTPRSRKSSVAGSAPPPITPSHGHSGPTTFFLRSGEEMEASLAQHSSSGRHNTGRDTRESTYGVQSLEDALDDAFGGSSSKCSDDEAGSEAGAGHSRAGSVAGSVSGSGKKRKIGRVGEEIQENLVKAKVAAFEKYIHEKDSPLNKSPTTQQQVGQHLRRGSLNTLSQPLTPLNAESPVPGSMGTPRSVSLKSFRLSDEEASEGAESGSVAVVSSGEEEEEEGSERGGRTEEGEGMGSAPQLVMPSIRMPTRRPFTERGRRMGRLKVMVAGRAGVGKTSLIKSIVHVCEDIVHVDQLSPSSSVMQKSKSKDKTTNADGTTEITEIHASTRAYPLWWSEMEESRVLRRRKSMGDTILERNICFIDTPGFDCSEENADSVVQYIEALLHRNASMATMSESDLLSMLSGNGGVQVDVVLYVFSHDADISKDVDYVRRLSTLTNVIPILSKADLLTPETITSLKTSILQHLDSATIQPFLFGKPIETALQSVTNTPDTTSPTAFDPTARLTAPSLDSTTQLVPVLPPYATSTLPSPDADTMDASLLMSPDYIQPLVPSDLAAFVSAVLNPDTVSWLRHSAAKKFLLWRREQLHRIDEPPVPRVASPSPAGLGLRNGRLGSASPSGVLVPFPRSVSPSAPSASAGAESSSLALSGLATHTQREERLARWATDLRASLANERARSGGNVLPLSERISGEGVRGKAEWALVRRGGMPAKARWAMGKGEEVDFRDPLGLAAWGEGVRRGGWVVLKVLGGAGVVGAVVLAVGRVWGGEWGWVPGFGWVEEWWRWGSGE